VELDFYVLGRVFEEVLRGSLLFAFFGCKVNATCLY